MDLREALTMRVTAMRQDLATKRQQAATITAECDAMATLLEELETLLAYDRKTHPKENQPRGGY
jgi:hypothetical protein